jgi:AraC-like DNA-binding protein
MLAPLLDAALFERLRAVYQARWPVSVLVCDAGGRVVGGDGAGPQPEAEVLAQAVALALRYGDPLLIESGSGRFCWAVPLLCNQRCLGGLVACCAEGVLLGEGDDAPAFDLRQALREFRELAEAQDLTNQALLAGRRDRQERERQRAAEIHAAKQGSHRVLVSAYLERERALLAAVRGGRRDAARAVLNEVLVAYYHAGSRQLDLLKSLLLELLVMLCRSAIEAGAAQEEIAGLRLGRVKALVGIDDDEALSCWLTASLEGIFDAVEVGRRRDDRWMLRELEQVLAERCGEEDLDRAEVARLMGLDGAALARLIGTQTGVAFADLLARVRIERARELLRDEDRSLLQIALEVGFKDPSYFTKVFRKLSGLTPRDYRKLLRG